MSTDRVRAALRAEAAGYQPDREAILARIERGQAADPARAPRTGRRRAAVRMAGIGTTVAAVLGLGVAVTWAAVNTDVLRRPSHGPMMASAPASSSPGPAQRPDTASRAPSGTHAPRPPAASPSTNGAQQRFLRSSGAIDAHNSIDNWTQASVKVTSTDTVTTLEVTVRIAGSPNLASTGAWSSVLAEFLTTSVERQPDALVYHFTLKPGVTLPPASHVFAVQYNHAVGGRDPSRDTYHAVATANGTRAEVSGGF
jgi:hypothetical protein